MYFHLAEKNLGLLVAKVTDLTDRNTQFEASVNPWHLNSKRLVLSNPRYGQKLRSNAPLKHNFYSTILCVIHECCRISQSRVFVFGAAVWFSACKHHSTLSNFSTKPH